MATQVELFERLQLSDVERRAAVNVEESVQIGDALHSDQDTSDVRMSDRRAKRQLLQRDSDALRGCGRFGATALELRLGGHSHERVTQHSLKENAPNRDQNIGGGGGGPCGR